jgi:hypothetical protein
VRLYAHPTRDVIDGRGVAAQIQAHGSAGFTCDV